MMLLESPAGSLTLRETPPDPMSLSALAMVIKRRWRLFLAVFASVVALALAAAFLLPPQYTADTRLTIDPRPHASSLAGRDSMGAPDSVLVDTEIGLITSPGVARAVVQRLGLAQDPEFAAPRGPGQLDRVVEKVRRHVSATREGLTYIVVIRARSSDRRKAALIANAMADQYISSSRGLRAAAAADQARALTADLGYLRKQVIDADAAVEAYRAAHGIVASRAADGGTVTDQQIHSLAAEYGAAVNAAAAADAAAAAARNEARTSGVESVSQVLASDSLRGLREQRAEVLRQQAQLTTIYGPEHPAMVRVNQQLARLNQEIKTASEGVVEGLSSDARAAEQRARVVRGELSNLEARQQQNAQAAVVADGLQRDADAKRATYNDLSRDAEQQAQEARVGDVRAWRMSLATPPLKPSFPNKTVTLMLGILFGAAASVGAVAAAELRDNGFRSGAEAQSALDLPFLAAAPEISSANRKLLPGAPERALEDAHGLWDFVVRRPASAYAEAMRSVRGTLLSFREDHRPPRTICVTSAVPGEGKTLTAVSLARIMAMSGDRVLLVDCDLRRTSLSRLRRTAPGGREGADLFGVLSGETEPQEAIIEDAVPGLTLLGVDQPTFTSRDVFSGPAARKMLERLKASYDFVIIDAPPVLAVADAWALASICDSTLLVVRHAKTPRAVVGAAVERLRQCGARLHGVVINRLVRHGLNANDPTRYYLVDDARDA
jgi:capsular exopolysaccharide synthesis family protein